MFLIKNPTIESNIKSHDRIARKYEKQHVEIYNSVEQERLRRELSKASEEIATGSQVIKVLDFGCGAGNLTRHLTEMGMQVLACDVSQGFLDLINSRDFKSEVITVKLNGIDMSNIEDESVDMLVTYSVLHHVPDYLAIVKEFVRVVKPGGVIYIDHESSEEVWGKNDMLDKFYTIVRKNTSLFNPNWFILTNYFDWFIRKFVNSRYRREGDIHVFPDDHIEWSKIIEAVKNFNIGVLYERDYLLYKKGYDVSVYNEFKDLVSDMHLLVLKKY